MISITWLGALTAFFGASSALLQNDLKRVIAYSTCSQLGYLVMSVGLSNYSNSLFHLVNHAYFKALLFLSAGKIVLALYSAKCWELHLDGQSAGFNINKLYLILRDYTLKISNIIHVRNSRPIEEIKILNEKDRPNKEAAHLNPINLNSKFNEYLAGLIEGDGCINIPNRYRDNSNKIISPQIILSFNSKDLPLALLIQKNLNMGQIYKIKGKNAYYYRISNLINLIKLISLINGYMRTPKINQLYKLIDYINARGYNINKLPLDNSSFNSNA